MTTHYVARKATEQFYAVYHSYDGRVNFYDNLTGEQVFYQDLIIEQSFDNAAEAFEKAAYVNHNIRQRKAKSQ